MKRALKLLFGLGVGALFLWLTLRQVDLAALGAALGSVSWSALALAPLCLALGYAARVIRWRRMLLAHNPDLGFGRPMVAFVGSIAVNNLAPFRLGDVLRCFGFSRWLGIAPGAITATVLVERLLDFIALLMALALALWVFSVSGSALGLGLGYGLGALGLLALALLIWPRALRPLASLGIRVARLINAALGDRVAGFADTLITTLTGLSRRGALAPLIGWTLPVWLFEGACFVAVARALPDLPVPSAGWLAMPVGSLSTLFPSTPGHVGPFDFFTQAATVAAGNPVLSATAFALIVHAVLWLTTTLTGGAMLIYWALTRERAAP